MRLYYFFIMKYLLILLLLTGCSGIIYCQAGYDTIFQDALTNYQPQQDSTLYKLKILDTKQQPLRILPVYIVDEINMDVYAGKTNLKGIAHFRLPKGKTYLINIHQSGLVSEVSLKDQGYMTVRQTITYNPALYTGVDPVRKENPIPEDTIWQHYQEMQRETSTHANVILQVRNMDEQPLNDVDLYLYDPKTKNCIASTTNSDGLVYLFLKNNNTYPLSFDDFQHYEDVNIPKRGFINLKKLVYYTPTILNEVISNDTIRQYFEDMPQPTSARVLLEFEVINPENKPIEGYPVYLVDIYNGSIYSSRSDHQGIAYLLVPKGSKYRLSYLEADFAHYIDIPWTRNYRTNKITYRTSGLLINEETYAAVDLMYPPPDWIYQQLPDSATLVNYCPPVGDQGAYGTCVGWAAAYYSYSITEAIQDGKENPINDTMIYSPTWIYEQIKLSSDINCVDGSYIESALELMHLNGNLSISEIPYACGSSFTNENFTRAEVNRIKDYRRLFEWYADDDEIINSVRRSLSMNHPVIIGFKTTTSFHSAGDFWDTSNDNNILSFFSGGHALTVIGYDDHKYGGAFQVVNSWDTIWGNNGYCWIKYEDFADHCMTAFEIFPQLEEDTKDAEILNGEINFYDGEDLQEVQHDNSVKNSYLEYHLDPIEISSDLLLMSIHTTRPSYLYIIGVNKNGKIRHVFPEKNESYSVYLGYPENIIEIDMEEVDDLSEVLFLFSKEALDIFKDVDCLNSLFSTDLSKIVEWYNDRMVPLVNIDYDQDSFDFKADFQSTDQILIVGVNLFD